MSQLKDRLRTGTFAITAEVVPPRSAGPKALLAEAEPLRGLVDAINLTDGAGATTTMSSAAAAAILVAHDLEPVWQITCRDRNRLALNADILGAAAQGVENVLILTGDDTAGGDQPDSKPVFDLNSSQVITLMRDMRDKKILPSGKTIVEAPNFLLGAADMPTDPEPDWQPTGMLSKIEAGAEFAQTQFCFDAGIASRYIQRLVDAGVTEKLGVLLGVGPIASAKSAHWMNKNLYGVDIPEHIIERIESAGDSKAQKQEGIKICAELIDQFKQIDGLGGVHIMAPAASSQSIVKVLNSSEQ